MRRGRQIRRMVAARQWVRSAARLRALKDRPDLEQVARRMDEGARLARRAS